MAPNSKEKIQEAFSKRTLEPSQQAWDRLDAMLTVAEKKSTKKNYFWLYIAASLVLFFGVGYFFFNQEETLKPSIKNEVVVKDNLEIESQESGEVSNKKDSSNTMSNSSVKKKENNVLQYKTNKIMLPLIDRKLAKKQYQLANVTNEVKQENKSNVALNIGTKTPIEEQNKVNTEKIITSYSYVTPEKLLAEVEGKKEAPVENTIKYQSKTKVDPNALLSSAEKEMGTTFREKALKQFNKAKTAFANRNVE
jgi:hypothetical protein